MTRLADFCRTLTGGAWITSPQNIYYLSHFAFDDGFLLLFPDAAYLVTDFRYEEAARAKADPDFTVLSPQTGAFSVIGALAARHGADTLLVEEEHLTLAMRDALTARFPSLTTTSGASRALAALRQYKDARELAAIRAAQQITDAAFSHILTFLPRAATEREIALELDTFMRKMGADGSAFQTIAVSGTASALPHGTPRDTLERGFLTMDFGARLGGYCSDMTRTVVLGRATEEEAHVYRTVLAAQTAALSAARVGISHRALDGVARTLIDEAGFKGCFGHSLGHGVGIDIHEAPRLSSRAPEDARLAPGEIVTIEPGIYLTGKFGCRIEDMITATQDGKILNLTHSPKELLEIT